MSTIPSSDYYRNYHGHLINHLETVYSRIKEIKAGNDSAGIIYLAGDSSLDNKFWLSSVSPAVNGYESILNPPVCVDDVAHLLNKEIVRRGLMDQYTAINAAVEESTLGQRACRSLTKQDAFIKSHVAPNDSVVISVGGNDIALRPTCCTILNLGALLFCTNASCINNCACGVPLPCDDCCCGCGAAVASNFLAWPCGYGYFLHMFKTKVQNYASHLVSGPSKPRKVIICMIYYLDMATTGSWADAALSCMGYNKNPDHLQSVIKSMYENATKRIRIPGVEVIALPLFIKMDGLSSEDYIQRVEPSEHGGKKLASLILDAVHEGRDAVELQYERWKPMKMDRVTG
jgi:hypothetical protein